MRLRRYRPLALVLLVLHLNACTTWRPTIVGPRQLIEEEEPAEVRVTRLDGLDWVLESPEVRADSIVGGDSNIFGFITERSVALTDVRQIEVKRFNGGRTLLAIVATPFAILAIGGIMLAFDPDSFWDAR